MLKIRNMSPTEFRRYIKDKTVIIYGAGRALESCLDIYFSDKEIELIIDRNASLWESVINHMGRKVEVQGVTSLISYIGQQKKERVLLFISSPFYAAEIVEELDSVAELNGLECYLQVLIRNTSDKIQPYEFSTGCQKIPKKIHYIWVGGQPLPKEYEQNIESWKRSNPDYEIVRWDESNYDFGKCDYVKEAYDTHSWGFVVNYPRLDIVYQYGGIYLDVDVEVLRSFDCLLQDRAFFNMGSSDRVNQGCGFGSEPKNDVVSRMKKQFEASHFLNKDGNPGKMASHTFFQPVLKKMGFRIDNQYQNIDGIALYPCDLMSPKTINGMPDLFSERTVSVHKESGLWRSEIESDGMYRLEGLLKRLSN